jgi:hypothetical protein
MFVRDHRISQERILGEAGWLSTYPLTLGHFIDFLSLGLFLKLSCGFYGSPQEPMPLVRLVNISSLVLVVSVSDMFPARLNHLIFGIAS